MLSPMRFGDYVWPHNPRIYEIEFNRRVVCHKVPFGLYALSDMGRNQRILRGEGVFVGENAYEEFKKLASMFYKDRPQVLVHPIWQTAPAWFVSLRLRQEPRPDYVSYAFEFWECFEGYERKAKELAVTEPEVQVPAERRVHMIRRGDTLWAISRANGLTLGELLALNPQVKNPNLCHVGDLIYLS